LSGWGRYNWVWRPGRVQPRVGGFVRWSSLVIMHVEKEKEKRLMEIGAVAYVSLDEEGDPGGQR